MNYWKERGPFPYEEMCTGVNAEIYKIHPSIFSAHKRNMLSPVEAWDNEELFNKIVENRKHYEPQQLEAANWRRNIVHGMSVAQKATVVSVFRWQRARDILKMFADIKFGTTIVDYFHGFSGRAIGAKELGLNYKSIDINPTTVAEAKAAGFNVKLGDANKVTLNGEWAFICPPYGDLEQWPGTPVDKRSADDWVDLVRSKGHKIIAIIPSKGSKLTKYQVQEINNLGVNKTGGKEMIIKII